MAHRTFVVRVYTDGSATVEDVRRRARVPVETVAEVGERITELLGTEVTREVIDLSSDAPTPKRR